MDLTSDFEEQQPPPAKRPREDEQPQVIVSDEEEEDGLQVDSNKENSTEVEEGCPICMERWTSSGSHRIASLRCGHLFGKSCINRWLSAAVGKTRCPQCNAPAKCADIRLLYVPKGLIRVLDTGEVEELKRQVEEERKLKREAQMAETNARLRRTMVEAEMERLRAELERLKDRLSVPQASTFPNFKYWRSYNVGGNGTICRGMIYDAQWSTLLISRQSESGNQAGIVRINCALPDAPFDTLPSLHTRSIKGMSLSDRGEGLLATASLDATVRLTSLASLNPVLCLQAPAPAWSVRWLDSHTIVAGLANASLVAWDTRQPSQVKWQLSLAEQVGGGGPLHSLVVEEGRLLVGHSQGVLSLDPAVPAFTDWLHRAGEGLTGLTSPAKGVYALSIRRPAPLVAQTCVLWRGREAIHHFDLQSPATLMTRAHVHEAHGIVLSANEATSSLLLHQIETKQVHSLPTNSGLPIQDCFIGESGQSVLLAAALTERTVSLWRHIKD